MVNTLVNFFVFGKKLWEIMENSFSSRFRLVLSLLIDFIQLIRALYTAYNLSFQAVSEAA